MVFYPPKSCQVIQSRISFNKKRMNSIILIM